MKTIGLIGGMTWHSTAEYYRAINELVNRRLGGDHAARCIIHSIDFHDMVEFNKKEDWEGAGSLFLSAARGLEKAGADCIVLCANTAHVTADRVQNGISKPLIHVADATVAEVRRQGLKTVSLLGTRFTMEHDFFRNRLTASGINVLIPEADARKYIHETIFAELARGIFRSETKNRYRSLIQLLAVKGAQGAVLACTEIPLLIKQKDVTVPLFDTTTIHAQAAVDFALAP